MHEQEFRLSFRTLILALIVLTASIPVWSGGVAVLGTTLSDNGDDDGFADTGETVTLRLTLQNTSGLQLSDVTARLVAQDPGTACISGSEVFIGNLAPGEITLTEPFVLTMSQTVDGTPQGVNAGPLSTTFGLTIFSQPENQPALPSKLTIHLDQDVTGGGGPTTFFESFENTFGAFENENIDQGLNDLETADGYRCQYTDPDWVNSNTHDFPQFGDQCYMGNSPAQADAVFWGLSGPGFSPLGGRGFSGFHSMFYGIDLGPPRNWTTPFANLEAVRTSAPINLAWDGTSPNLSFKQQVSFADDRIQPVLDPDEGYDRGIVMVQLADPDGQPVGDWLKLDPYQNVYDKTNERTAFNCTFDPTDDGTTEDDFFDPTDPDRRLGPSSTCYPELAFVLMGDTDEPFDPNNLGTADGPGLQGMWGIGTWVESKFDLSRYRGQRVNLRFLGTTIEFGAADFAHWEDLTGLNPHPADDGWWIDDVAIEGALQTPAVITVDNADNSALPGPPGGDDDVDGISDTCDNCPFEFNPEQIDLDFDGFGPPCDCDELLGTTFPGAAEVNDGVDNQCPGDPGFGIVDETSGNSGFHNPDDKNEYSWPDQPGAASYEVARSESPGFPAGCKIFGLLVDPLLIDVELPPSGTVFHYLNHAVLPNTGSWGQDSTGLERTVCE